MKTFRVLLQSQSGSPVPPIIAIDAERRDDMLEALRSNMMRFYNGNEVVAEIRVRNLDAVWED